MVAPREGFIRDCQTLVTEQLRITDAWSALQQEFSTFSTNGVVIDDAAVQAVIPGVTAAQFNAALVAEQEVVDFTHTATRAAKLYRIRR